MPVVNGQIFKFKEDKVHHSGWLTVGGLAVPFDVQSPWETRTPLSLMSWSSCGDRVPVCVYLFVCDVSAL